MERVSPAQRMIDAAPALFAVAVMLVPLLFLSVTTAEPFRGTPEVMVLVFTWLFVLAVAVSGAFQSETRVAYTLCEKSVFGLAVWILLSAIVAPQPASSLAYAETAFTYLVLGLATSNWLNAGPQARRSWIFAGLAAMVGIETVIGGLQAAHVDFLKVGILFPAGSYFWNYFGVIGGVSEDKLPFGTLGNPNVLGEFLALITPVLFGWALTFQRVKVRWVAAIILLAPLMLLLSTTCRAAFLGLLLFAPIAALLAFGRAAVRPGDWLASRMGKASAVVVAVALCASLIFAGGPLLKKMHATTSGAVDVDVRMIHWRIAASIWRDHPIFGAGLGSFRRLDVERLQQAYPLGVPEVTNEKRFNQAHSEPLQSLAELGLGGFLLIGVLLISWFLEARRNLGLPRVMRFGLFWGVGALLFASFFGFPLHSPVTAMALAFILGVGLSRPASSEMETVCHANWLLRASLAVLIVVVLGGTVVSYDAYPLYRSYHAQYEADQALANGDYVQAIELYGQAHDHGRFKGGVVTGELKALAHQGRFQDMVDLYNANVLEGMDIEATRLDGIALAALGRKAEAVGQFTAIAHFYGQDHPISKWAQAQIAKLQ